MPASLFGVASGSLTQPIFQRRMLRTQLEVARVERKERVIEFRQSVMQAVHEVTNSMATLDNWSSSRWPLREWRHWSRPSKMRSCFSAAVWPIILEVISAQSRSSQAELDEAAILRQRLGARVELYKSLGGEWQ